MIMNQTYNTQIFKIYLHAYITVIMKLKINTIAQQRYMKPSISCYRFTKEIKSALLKFHDISLGTIVRQENRIKKLSDNFLK